MRTKLEYAMDNFMEIEYSLMCPLCQNDLIVSNQSLKCELNHTFNINRKGLVTFSNPLTDKVYNSRLFSARKRVLQTNLYHPIMEEIVDVLNINNSKLVVDVGCGEGSYLNYLSQRSNHKFLGVDLSKDGLNIASDYTNINFIIADLADLPLKNSSVDYLINILSPANYREFERVLGSDGLFIKVILEENYLKELRDELALDSVDNSDVLSLLKEHMDIIENRRVTYTKSVDLNLSQDIFLMTPMSQFKQLEKQLSQITIDLRILICKKRRKA